MPIPFHRIVGICYFCLLLPNIGSAKSTLYLLINPGPATDLLEESSIALNRIPDRGENSRVSSENIALDIANMIARFGHARLLLLNSEKAEVFETTSVNRFKHTKHTIPNAESKEELIENSSVLRKMLHKNMKVYGVLDLNEDTELLFRRLVYIYKNSEIRWSLKKNCVVFAMTLFNLLEHIEQTKNFSDNHLEVLKKKFNDFPSLFSQAKLEGEDRFESHILRRLYGVANRVPTPKNIHLWRYDSITSSLAATEAKIENSSVQNYLYLSNKSSLAKLLVNNVESTDKLEFWLHVSGDELEQNNLSKGPIAANNFILSVKPDFGNAYQISAHSILLEDETHLFQLVENISEIGEKTNQYRNSKEVFIKITFLLQDPQSKPIPKGLYTIKLNPPKHLAKEGTLLFSRYKSKIKKIESDNPLIHVKKDLLIRFESVKETLSKRSKSQIAVRVIQNSIRNTTNLVLATIFGGLSLWNPLPRSLQARVFNPSDYLQASKFDMTLNERSKIKVKNGKNNFKRLRNGESTSVSMGVNAFVLKKNDAYYLTLKISGTQDLEIRLRDKPLDVRSVEFDYSFQDYRFQVVDPSGVYYIFRDPFNEKLVRGHYLEHEFDGKVKEAYFSPTNDLFLLTQNNELIVIRDDKLAARVSPNQLITILEANSQNSNSGAEIQHQATIKDQLTYLTSKNSRTLYLLAFTLFFTNLNKSEKDD